MYTWEGLAAARRQALADKELAMRDAQPRPWSEAALVESGDECMLLNEERWRPQPLAPTCSYIRLDGSVCFDPPEQRGMCGRHARWQWLLPAAQGLPCPEDRASMFEVLAQTMAMLLAGRIKPAKATAIASLCHQMQRCW